jgi:hypothetical protein
MVSEVVARILARQSCMHWTPRKYFSLEDLANTGCLCDLCQCGVRESLTLLLRTRSGSKPVFQVSNRQAQAALLRF